MGDNERKGIQQSENMSNEEARKELEKQFGTAPTSIKYVQFGYKEKQ